ncbi:hypothetical protein, partial [Enterobacter hormaechei]
NKSVIKKLIVLRDRLQMKANDNTEVFIAHSNGIYSIVIETHEGDDIKEAYYHHLGKLKGTSVNSTFLDRQLSIISSTL